MSPPWTIADFRKYRYAALQAGSLENCFKPRVKSGSHSSSIERLNSQCYSINKKHKALGFLAYRQIIVFLVLEVDDDCIHGLELFFSFFFLMEETNF